MTHWLYERSKEKEANSYISGLSNERQGATRIIKTLEEIIFEGEFLIFALFNMS